ncbi:cytidine deaminase-like protein [Zopfia rhizophila CBS 207.26]|uniref:Cytidine deaminase-like protein n=1 Tax=Zopfia rhizophila CBS 207.26 TaxID=1314779 RepID=A0A6A6DYZ9_9PEZI|nr:cytidine deaminase-like protein [Zopfia rhizophila CBS 207.26]
MVTPEAAEEAVSCSIERLGNVPRPGRLVALKTKDEVRAALETFEAYIVGVSAKFAGAILNVIRESLPDLKTAEFQHLRRVVSFEYLPQHLQTRFGIIRYPESDIRDETDGFTALTRAEIRYLLVSPITAISQSGLIEVLAKKPPFLDASALPAVFTIPVPALAPTSAEQAAQWTRDFWPISYKNTNPYGPHPSLVARNTADIEEGAGTYLALAEAAGEQISELSLGEKVGCVIVDKTGGDEQIIAVTGDCRWQSRNGGPMKKEEPGNVMAHAVQRGIAMVAKKRLRVAGTNPESISSSKVFCDSPLTDHEKHFYSLDNIPPNGYLCSELDIYITHEPCVMCSMAILHSRFRRCVFSRRMPLTGGMTAGVGSVQGDGSTAVVRNVSGLGHGIFWRPSELNWKFLAWEWIDTDRLDTYLEVKDTLQA